MNKNKKILVVGNSSGSKHSSTRILDINGVCCTVMENHGAVVKVAIPINHQLIQEKQKKNKRKEVVNIKNTDKLRLFDSFAGVGALHSALTRLNVPLEVVGLSEIDPDAIINYCAIHIDTDLSPINGPSIEEKRQYLMDRNIGFSFEKNKSSIPRMRIDKLEKLYTASIKTKNFGDISKLDYKAMPDFDLFNFSFPCTDISNAGKQKGFTNEDGTSTRSGLVKYGIDLIRAKKPRYIMIENVKALIQKKFLGDFYSIINELESIGYNCHYPTKQNPKKETVPSCLDAKNFGIPQHRERIFVICILKEFDDNSFNFPTGFPLKLKLKDILEDTVEDRYYLRKEISDRFTHFPSNRLNGDIEVFGTTAANPRDEDGNLIIGNCTSSWVLNPQKIISTLTARDYKQPKQIIEEKYFLKGTKTFFIKNSLKMEEKGTGFRFEPHIKENADIAKTITTRSGDRMDDNFLLYDEKTDRKTLKFESKNTHIDLLKDYRIRKLTPRECFYLMGFSEEEFNRVITTGCSNSSLYKQAGNSIVVDVLFYIFKNLLGDSNE